MLGRRRGHEGGRTDAEKTRGADRLYQRSFLPDDRLFGNDDKSPSPEQVNQHEAELKKCGKNYEFHRYDGAGHGFFYYDRPAYRQEQAVDGWKKVLAFCEKNLK